MAKHAGTEEDNHDQNSLNRDTASKPYRNLVPLPTVFKGCEKQSDNAAAKSRPAGRAVIGPFPQKREVDVTVKSDKSDEEDKEDNLGAHR